MPGLVVRSRSGGGTGRIRNRTDTKETERRTEEDNRVVSAAEEERW